MADIDPQASIVQLEDELKRRDEKIQELREEVSEAEDLVRQMREHVEDAGAMIDQWVYVFEMQQDEAGVWKFDPLQTRLWEYQKYLIDRHEKLVRDWNRLVPKYNRAVAPQPLGRPLGASKAQVEDVLKRHKDGASLRAIAAATSLGLRTVRTILEKDAGTDRTSKRMDALRKREFDRLRAADFRARKRARDELPKRIAGLQKRGAELVKAAKGIHKAR